MKTIEEPTPIRLISSTTPRDLWSHPTLNLYPDCFEERKPQEALLYSTPSTFGELFDEDDRPVPTSATELPDIHRWVMNFATNVLEKDRHHGLAKYVPKFLDRLTSFSS